MKRLLALLLLSALALPLLATPTRVLTLDNNNLLVPDDNDGIAFYHLAPHFKNHLYLDVLPSGKAEAWTFLDIKIGTLVLWWNHDYVPGSLYGELAARNKLGYSLLDLQASATSAQAPLETRILAPDNKFSGGYALELNDSMSLGVCLQVARLEQARDSQALEDFGAAPVAGAPFSLARYFTPGAGFYGSLTETSYTNSQVSNGFAVAPLLGINGDSFSLDLKVDLMWNSIDNRHTEALRDAQGGAATRVGEVTQSLKDKGALSYAPKARLRVPLGDSTFVLKGGFKSLDLSTEHRQKGVFLGGGFANADELAGFDHVDAEEALTISGWDAMMGWLQSFNQNKTLIVLGLGASSSAARANDTLYSPRTGGATIKYNDLVRLSRRESLEENFALPVLLGAEQEVMPWLWARGVVQRNFWALRRQSLHSLDYDSASGNVLSENQSLQSTDLSAQWTLAVGLGLKWGSFQWDNALSSSFLASSAGLVNPVSQSTLTWGF